MKFLLVFALMFRGRGTINFTILRTAGCDTATGGLEGEEEAGRGGGTLGRGGGTSADGSFGGGQNKIGCVAFLTMLTGSSKK